MLLLLLKYPHLSQNTPTDLLATAPSIYWQKSTTAEHRGPEAVVRAPSLHHLWFGGNRSYFFFASICKKGEAFTEFYPPPTFFSFSPISTSKKKASHCWGAWWPKGGSICGYTLCFDRDSGLDLFMLDPDCQPHHTGGEGGPGLGPDCASGAGSCVFPFLLQKQRGKAKRRCVIWESLCVISAWEQCPLPAANVLKTGPRDKDYRRGNLLAACPQSGLWRNSSEGKGSSLNSSVHMDCPCSFQSWHWLGRAGKQGGQSVRLPGLSAENGQDLMKKCKWMHDWKEVRGTRDLMRRSMHDLQPPWRCNAASTQQRAGEGSPSPTSA